LLGSVVAKLASLALSEKEVRGEMERWSEYFFKVTNNLYVYYKYLNECVINYWTTRNVQAVETALE
jgi:hypothetical protein